MPILGNQPGELLQTILENVGVAIAVADAEGKLVFANGAALSMFGMNSLPQPVHLKDWVRDYRFQDRHGHDIPVERSAAMRTLAGEKVEPQDICATLPDGKCKWLHTSAHPFSVMGLAGVLVIITDETKEVELQRTSAQLQRMEDVASTAVGLAHNFNNVLATISMNATLALAEESVGETTRARLEQITDASWKAAGVVKRLMQFSRTRELQIQRVQINSLINQVLKLVEPTLTKSVQVHAALRQDLPELEADPAELEQVLVNLILNATDAMPHGGDLTIATELACSESEEATNNEETGHFVIITVADTGTGIQEDIRDRIFDPFFTTKTAESGTGLGLASAYGIVRQHQGKIEVWSVPGKGTKFTIHLPVRQFVLLEEGSRPSAA